MEKKGFYRYEFRRKLHLGGSQKFTLWVHISRLNEAKLLLAKCWSVGPSQPGKKYWSRSSFEKAIQEVAVIGKISGNCICIVLSFV